MDFGKPVFVYYISICMPMLGLLPLLHWVKRYFGRKSRRVLEIYEVAEQPDSNMLWLIVLICIAAVLLAGYYGHQRKRRNS